MTIFCRAYPKRMSASSPYIPNLVEDNAFCLLPHKWHIARCAGNNNKRVFINNQAPISNIFEAGSHEDKSMILEYNHR